MTNLRDLNSFHFKSDVGEQSIYYKVSLPKNRKNLDTVLIFIHDVFDYHERYLFLHDLVPREIDGKVAIVWVDMKGFGLSGGTRGHIDSFDEYSSDLQKLALSLKESEPFSEIEHELAFVLAGQGFGGLVALRHHQVYRDSEDYNIKGLVAINPIIKLNEGSSFWSSFFFEKLGTPLSHFRWSSTLDLSQLVSKPEELELMYNDVLVSDLMTVGFYKEIVRVGQEVKEDSYFLDIPCFFLLSGRDRLVRRDVTKLFCKGISKDKAQLVFYPKSFHDLLHDIDGKMAIDEIFNWLKSNFLK